MGYMPFSQHLSSRFCSGSRSHDLALRITSTGMPFLLGSFPEESLSNALEMSFKDGGMSSSSRLRRRSVASKAVWVTGFSRVDL